MGVLGRGPADPLDADRDILGVAGHRHGHPLDEGTNDLVAIGHRGIGGVPQGRDVGGQGLDAVELLRGEPTRRLEPESIVRFPGFTLTPQGVLPLLFECPCDQPVNPQRRAMPWRAAPRVVADVRFWRRRSVLRRYCCQVMYSGRRSCRVTVHSAIGACRTPG
jgi:hypothetical protein